MLAFDDRGHVHPYEVINLTLEELEQVFVNEMEDREHRKRLFQNYLCFLDGLKSALGISFFQWIDGSFTTQKPTPIDIDIVSFIDYDQYVKKIHVLNHYYLLGKADFNTDAHFATTCKWNHRFQQRSLNDEAYWKDIFGKSRPDENGQQHPKGIIKLNFQVP